MKLVPLALLSAALLGVMMVSSASAQYPPPQGAVTLGPSDANPGVGETITVDVTITPDEQASSLTGDGFMRLAATSSDAPASSSAVFQAVASCTAGITGGSGATVTPESFSTDDDGNASLSVYTGTVPGTLTLAVTCDVGSAQLTINVGEDDDDGGDGDGDGDDDNGAPSPPDTGTGDAAATNGGVSTATWLAGTGALVLVAAAGAFYVRRARSA